MEEKDSIKDLFQEKLSQLETPVRPELWSAVSSSIASSSAVATSTGMSLLAKITIGITIAASVTGTVIFLSKDETKETPKIEVQKANKQQESKSNPTENKVENNSTVSTFNNSNPVNRDSENTTTATNNIFESIIDNSTSNNTNLVEGPISYAQIETKEEVKAPKNNPKVETSTSAQNQEPKQNIATEKLPEESKLQFKLPNIFTPNGDGNNDYLKLDITNVTEFVIVILDAKSNVVFKSEDIDFKWDGTNLNGDKLPTGNYIYYVTAKDLEGKAVTKYSSLTIKY
jgi:gliding motility-associated-like protein